MLEKALEYDPGWITVLTWRSKVFMRTKKWEKGEEDQKIIMKHKSDSSKHWYVRYQ